ncbi:MAG: hypothetical protein COU27_00075, partial [Candidatus Levybacteria bacterium CG10_big_fil_rev_8_21_14_0_10_36_7]
MLNQSRQVRKWRMAVSIWGILCLLSFGEQAKAEENFFDRAGEFAQSIGDIFPSYGKAAKILAPEGRTNGPRDSFSIAPGWEMGFYGIDEETKKYFILGMTNSLTKPHDLNFDFSSLELYGFRYTLGGDLSFGDCEDFIGAFSVIEDNYESLVGGFLAKKLLGKELFNLPETFVYYKGEARQEVSTKDIFFAMNKICDFLLDATEPTREGEDFVRKCKTNLRVLSTEYTSLVYENLILPSGKRFSYSHSIGVTVNALAEIGANWRLGKRLKKGSGTVFFDTDSNFKMQYLLGTYHDIEGRILEKDGKRAIGFRFLYCPYNLMQIQAFVNSNGQASANYDSLANLGAGGDLSYVAGYMSREESDSIFVPSIEKHYINRDNQLSIGLALFCKLSDFSFESEKVWGQEKINYSLREHLAAGQTYTPKTEGNSDNESQKTDEHT